MKVNSENKQGLLLEVVQILTDMNLIITKSYISSDGGWFMDGTYISPFLIHLHSIEFRLIKSFGNLITCMQFSMLKMSMEINSLIKASSTTLNMFVPNLDPLNKPYICLI